MSLLKEEIEEDLARAMARMRKAGMSDDEGTRLLLAAIAFSGFVVEFSKTEEEERALFGAILGHVGPILFRMTGAERKGVSAYARFVAQVGGFSFSVEDLMMTLVESEAEA